MNNREKLLGVLVLAVLVGLGARSVHSNLTDKYNAYVNQERAKRNELDLAKDRTVVGELAAQRMNVWKERSLPADQNMANISYEEFLYEELTQAGLDVEIKIPGYNRIVQDKATLITYTVDAEGTLRELVDFLYEFYRAPHLHKISSLHVTPDDEGKSLTVTMKVEAYSLWDADRVDELAEGESERLALESAGAYRDSIVDRNIFAVYTPPKPPEPEVPAEETIVDTGPPPFDHARHAIATGIVGWNQEAQVWINVQTTGEKHYLFPGESFKINDLTVKIVEIGANSFVFEADGKTYSVRLGKSLRDGEPIEL